MSVNVNEIIRLYVEDKKSIPEVSKIIGCSRTTVRYHLKRNQCLRTREEGHLLARHKMGGKGVKRNFTQEHKEKIRQSMLQHSEKHAKGFRIGSKGYYEVTKGKHKGRLLHVVIMEALKGRKLNPNEVVHHKDENKLNNDPNNLELMTRSEHARHHAQLNIVNRTRNQKGQLV